MARRVGDNETACRRRKKSICDINGDTLLAFRLQPIDQQRQIKAVGDRPVFTAISSEGNRLIIKHALGVDQQTTDQRRLAVVDATAGQKPQKTPLLGKNSLPDHQK